MRRNVRGSLGVVTVVSRTKPLHTAGSGRPQIAAFCEAEPRIGYRQEPSQKYVFWDFDFRHEGAV